MVRFEIFIDRAIRARGLAQAVFSFHILPYYKLTSIDALSVHLLTFNDSYKSLINLNSPPSRRLISKVRLPIRGVPLSNCTVNFAKFGFES
jgi:hypothetical protein